MTLARAHEISDLRTMARRRLPRPIFDYMDGGAEVYLAFDFQRVFARKYAGPGGLELGLDIYDMRPTLAAKGLKYV